MVTSTDENTLRVPNSVGNDASAKSKGPQTPTEHDKKRMKLDHAAADSGENVDKSAVKTNDSSEDQKDEEGSIKKDTKPATTGFGGFAGKPAFSGFSSFAGSGNGFGVKASSNSSFGTTFSSSGSANVASSGFGSVASSDKGFGSSVSKSNGFSTTAKSAESDESSEGDTQMKENTLLKNKGTKISNGEEGEKAAFQVRAKLYKLNEMEWVECGVGPLRILDLLNNDDPSTSEIHSSRLVMRRETYSHGPGTKLILNVPLSSCISVEKQAEKNIRAFFLQKDDESGETIPSTYLLRVADEDQAGDLLDFLNQRKRKKEAGMEE